MINRFISFHSRGLTVIACLLLAVAVALWFGVPILLVNYMNQRLANLPDYRGHVDRMSINLWDASFDLHGNTLNKRGAEIPVPFFVSDRIHIALQWSEILHGTFRSYVTIIDPQVNAIAGKSDSESQFSTSRQLVEQLKNLVPFQINRLDIEDGDIHFHDLRESPPVDLEMDQVNVSAQNLTNSKQLTSHYPSTIDITGRPLCSGLLKIHVVTNLAIKEPTFIQQISMESVSATGLNSALSKYARLTAKRGKIDLFSVIKSEHGQFVGYIKPFMDNVSFDSIPADKDSPLALWSDIANALKGMIENDNKIIATRVELSGNFDDPKTDLFDAILGVLSNAWIDALKKGLDPISSSDLEEARNFTDADDKNQKSVEKSGNGDLLPLSGNRSATNKLR